MSVEPLNTLLAIKVINLMHGLRPSDRQVGVLLIEHYNRKNGRCDPSIARLAVLLGLSTRTVLRSVKNLEMAGLFKKIRHGSNYSHRNSYTPNWSRFAELSASWDNRLKLAAKSRAAELSPSGQQSSHVEGESDVTQTYRTNLHHQTYKKDSRESKRVITAPTSFRRPPSFASTSAANAASTAAERRWTDALHRRFRSMPITYGEIIDAVDPQMRDAATQAEMKHQGAGFYYILRQLKLADPKC